MILNRQKDKILNKYKKLNYLKINSFYIDSYSCFFEFYLICYIQTNIKLGGKNGKTNIEGPVK